MSVRFKLPKINPLSVFFALLSVGYPLLVYFGLLHFSARWVALVIAVLLSLRLWALQSNTKKFTHELKQNPLMIALSLAIVCAVITVALNHSSTLRLIPVAISSAFLFAFGITLWRPPTMIERFSRMGNPNPTPAIIAYTRKVTIVWCGFFSGNALIALYTALYSSMAVWTLYNGLISYALMGCLFAIEYLIRMRVKAKDAQDIKSGSMAT